MAAADLSAELCARVAEARRLGRRLRPVGAGTRYRLLPALSGVPADSTPAELLSLADHAGIELYEPAELVLRARAGTPLHLLEQTLAAENQQLGFEPPRFQGGGTLGGAVAMGLAGPGRPWLGSVADALLGVRLVNGLGEDLRFGGEVMKNVAGFDVTRLQAGARGALGALLSVSLRVQPRPEREETRVLSLTLPEALGQLQRWRSLPVPLTASAWYGGQLYLRLAGPAQAVTKAAALIGGDGGAAAGLWSRLRDQELDWFRQPRWLVRVSLPPAAPAAASEDFLLPGSGFDVNAQLVEWGGGLRWLFIDEADQLVRGHRPAGGWAALFRAQGNRHPGTADADGQTPLRKLAARLKHAFDPDHVFENELVLDANTAS